MRIDRIDHFVLAVASIQADPEQKLVRVSNYDVDWPGARSS